MAKGTREIRRKIKSTKNTRQITKAMELVSASKMRRAVANTLALRPYARMAQALLANLAERTTNKEQGAEQLHPLLRSRPVEKILVVVVSTDRGLCGVLNAQLFRKLNELIRTEHSKDKKAQLSFVAVGRKAQDFLRRMDQKVIAAYGAMSNKPTLKDTFPLSKMILNDYTSGAYDKVVLAYTDYISALSQKTVVRRLLPLSQLALEEMVESVEVKKTQPTKEEKQLVHEEYIFEPSPEKVLEMLLPRLTEMQIYQAVLEATASEHAARMFAMRNASDNASQLIDDLNLLYNKIRQASITAELAEISAGRAALG